MRVLVSPNPYIWHISALSLTRLNTVFFCYAITLMIIRWGLLKKVFPSMYNDDLPSPILSLPPWDHLIGMRFIDCFTNSRSMRDMIYVTYCSGLSSDVDKKWVQVKMKSAFFSTVAAKCERNINCVYRYKPTLDAIIYVIHIFHAAVLFIILVLYIWNRIICFLPHFEEKWCLEISKSHLKIPRACVIGATIQYLLYRVPIRSNICHWRYVSPKQIQIHVSTAHTPGSFIWPIRYKFS